MTLFKTVGFSFKNVLDLCIVFWLFSVALEGVVAFVDCRELDWLFFDDGMLFEVGLVILVFGVGLRIHVWFGFLIGLWVGLLFSLGLLILFGGIGEEPLLTTFLGELILLLFLEDVILVDGSIFERLEGAIFLLKLGFRETSKDGFLGGTCLIRLLWTGLILKSLRGTLYLGETLVSL